MTAVSNLMPPKRNVYLCVFLSSYQGYENTSCGTTYKPLSDALDRGIWPYDKGDDPSFLSRKRSGKALTWGICRPQVRNAIQAEDIVVFFSVRRRDKWSPFEYCLCAVATVRNKVRHSDIWQDPALLKYKTYLNLLIRPKGSGWKHHEPGSEKPHKDWVWRIGERNGFRVSEFTEYGEGDHLPSNARVRGHHFSMACNYVIFSEDKRETLVLRQPPLVAVCSANGRTEQWRSDKTTKTVRSFTLDSARRHGKRDYLRTPNTQHSHPPIRWSMPADKAEEWRTQFISSLRGI